MNIPSYQPELGNVFSLSRFKGFYCFTGLVACVDLDGLPFWKVEVCDYQNSLIVYCRNLENLIPRFYPFCFLQIEVKMSRVNGYIYPVMDHIDIPNAIPSHCCHLHMLPYKAAYQLNDFNQLIELGRYITIPALATFIAQTLINQAVMLPFLRNPASKQHHHAYPGGLLQHSIDVAYKFQQHHDLTKEERELIIIGGLFHDIGKVKTLTDNNQLTFLGSMIKHDALRLEVD